MKKLIISAAIAVLLLSAGCTIADMNDLPENPSAGVVVEILDQSKIVSLDFDYDAVSYYSLILSDAGWLGFLLPDVEVTYPSGGSSDVTFYYSEASDGTVTITGARNSNTISQGSYGFTVNARDEDWSIRESFDYSFSINVDSSGSALSVRNPDSYSPSAPYVCNKESAFTLAISDDGYTIYVKADDPDSCEQVLIAGYYNDSLSWGFAINADVFQAGKYTAIPVSEINISTTVANFRSSTYYDKIAYASTGTTSSWGTLWRSELSETTTDINAPDSGDIIQLTRSAGSWKAEPTPLGAEFMKGGPGER